MIAEHLSYPPGYTTAAFMEIGKFRITLTHTQKKLRMKNNFSQITFQSTFLSTYDLTNVKVEPSPLPGIEPGITKLAGDLSDRYATRQLAMRTAILLTL